MSITTLTPDQLRKAADLKEKIAKLESELASLLGGSVAAKPAAKPVAKKKFTMSAAAKAKISAAVKARWAKIRAAKAK